MIDRPYKVYKIEKGIVIDHIPNKRALDVIKILGLDSDFDSLVTLGMNLDSGKMGSKDVVKIENKELSKEDLNKLALVCPNVTINIIQDSTLVNKHKAELPTKVEGLIKCPNPGCVTRIEDIKTIFYPVEEKLKCHYCERSFEKDRIELK